MATTSKPPAQAKELLYSWVANGFNVLVPKQRGEGFLKVPYGHHIKKGLDAAADAGNCDVYGLDGVLEFNWFTFDAGKRAAFVSAVVPLLEAHYGWPAREIDQYEFWRLRPTTK